MEVEWKWNRIRVMECKHQRMQPLHIHSTLLIHSFIFTHMHSALLACIPGVVQRVSLDVVRPARRRVLRARHLGLRRVGAARAEDGLLGAPQVAVLEMYVHHRVSNSSERFY
jgi:hypothetical protein